jgi:hypothetical protein
VPASDDFATELRGDEDEPLNAKGNDWVASIVGGLIVGVVLAGTNYLLGKDKDDNATLVTVQTELVALKTRFEYLAASINQLTGQPHVRREEYQSGIGAIENRVSGLEKRVDSLEQRAGRGRR